jgi:TonB family protein
MRRTAWVLGLLVLAGTLAWGQNVAGQADKDGVYTMAQGMTPAILVHAVPAVYPSDPGLVKLKHVVALRMVVGADGTPGAIQLEDAHPSPFDDAAIAAVKGSQFTAAKLAGKPVPTRLKVWVPFLGEQKEVLPILASAAAKGVSMLMPLNSPVAEFPEEARKDNVKAGMVLIHMLVTEEGLPSDMHVIIPVGHGLDESALKAAAKYRFTPAKFQGVPVPMEITVEVNFSRY